MHPGQAPLERPPIGLGRSINKLGSDYTEGILKGLVVNLEDDRVKV